MRSISDSGWFSVSNGHLLVNDFLLGAEYDFIGYWGSVWDLVVVPMNMV